MSVERRCVAPLETFPRYAPGEDASTVDNRPPVFDVFTATTKALPLSPNHPELAIDRQFLAREHKEGQREKRGRIQITRGDLSSTESPTGNALLTKVYKDIRRRITEQVRGEGFKGYKAEEEIDRRFIEMAGIGRFPDEGEDGQTFYGLTAEVYAQLLDSGDDPATWPSNSPENREK